MSVIDFIKNSASVHDAGKVLLYQEHRVRNTDWKETRSDSYNSKKGGYPVKPGFFTPFLSLTDFGRQFKSPIAAPILCSMMLSVQALSCVGNLLMGGLNMLVNEPKLAGDQLRESADSFIAVCMFTYFLIADTVKMMLALLARIVATIASGATVLFNKAKDLVSSKEETAEGEEMEPTLHNEKEEEAAHTLVLDESDEEDEVQLITSAMFR